MYDSLRRIFIISATNCIFNQFQPLDQLRPAFLLPSRSAPALCTPILPQDRPLVKAGSRGKFRHRMLYSRASCAKGVDLCRNSPCSDLFTSRKIFLLHTFRELPRRGKFHRAVRPFQKGHHPKGVIFWINAPIQTAFHLSHCRPRKGSNRAAYKDKPFPKSCLKEDFL